MTHSPRFRSRSLSLPLSLSLSLSLSLLSCTSHPNSSLLIKDLNLKRGAVVSCSPSGQEYGALDFQMEASDAVKEKFMLGVKMLHSFEYDEAEKVFADVIELDPNCAMAYWGVAMSNFHPLWTPPTGEEVVKGQKAIQIASQLEGIKDRERDYLNAIHAYYNNWEPSLHRKKCLEFESAMANLHRKYPDDSEAAIFYALSMIAAADPSDKSYKKQLEATALLNSLYPAQPNHPGIIHYLIHAYDYPGIASNGLEAARKYASIAPASAHALHMPSHIFTRMGLWEECIQSNLNSVSSAQCYAKQTGMDGNWDEELHGLDYLVYAYLQKGDNEQAVRYREYLQKMKKVEPANFKVAYSAAAIPARIVLENKLWKAAADLPLISLNIQWEDHPWQKAIYHFTRGMGALQTNDLNKTQAEIDTLQKLKQVLESKKDAYKAERVHIQILTLEAWTQFRKGNGSAAIGTMKQAADLEDGTEKHPVTPGDIIPAREWLGELYLVMGKNEDALAAFEAVMERSPNRFNSVYGAAKAAKLAGKKEISDKYYHQLLQLAIKGSERKELQEARKAVGVLEG